MNARLVLRGCALAVPLALLPALAASAAEPGKKYDLKNAEVQRVTDGGLEWLAKNQSRMGHWAAQNRYPTAMTALAGTALLGGGSTTTQGKYKKNVTKAVDYLLSRRRSNGLIGDPTRDDRYTYGHGFAMLFLSQVLGEEEDAERREELIKTLAMAAKFSGQSQTPAGGWGYVSAKDGGGFDEGSTTITQVQGLRGCRNAAVPVPKEIIDKAIVYIHKCTTADGGVQYNSHGGGGRPAISAAAIACLYNAGEYDGDYVGRVLGYCQKNLDNISNQGFGHWHYAHYYYSQVVYRQGGETWEKYRDKVFPRIISEAKFSKEMEGGKEKELAYWDQGYIGVVYTTAMNLTILQLEKGALPIYQR